MVPMPFKFACSLVFHEIVLEIEQSEEASLTLLWNSLNWNYEVKNQSSRKHGKSITCHLFFTWKVAAVAHSVGYLSANLLVKLKRAAKSLALTNVDQ
jgi:hypothetical protein